jgi:subtilisin family serine protease
MLVQSYSAPESKPIWNRGITGEGQIVGIGDTGLDTYHCFFYDEKNAVPYQRTQGQNVVSKHRKINAFWEYMDKTDSMNGHGTHVCGIISGQANPTLSPAPVKEFNSLAYGSKLNFMDCGCDTDAGCTCPSDTQCECDLKFDRKCEKKFGVVYLPLDLSDGYFPWFYNKGARIVSNSWGTGYYKDFSYGYSTSSAEIDDFAYAHKDFLPLFAAGNSGGVYGYASLTSESEAKNALIVGSSMSMLQSFQANTNYTDFTNIIDHYRVELFQRYCSKGSLDYNVDLCNSAKIFDEAACCDDGGACGANPTLKCCGVQKYKDVPGIGMRCCPKCINLEIENVPKHFNPDNLAFFTARGPALDGRIKPDIVTVGDFVLSSKARGTVPENACKADQKMPDVMTKKEGTSMSSPVAGAAAALVRQYYSDGFYPSGDKVAANAFNPSAALVKATLIHSASLLTGYIYLLSKHIWWNLVYQEGQRFHLTSPYMQGFGKIELNSILAKDSGIMIPNKQDREISTGDIHSYCVAVTDSKKPFKATLVWTDPASSPAARLHLVNDLDLIVISSSKNIYYGNGQKSRIGTARDSTDYMNNVEAFTYENAPLEKYNVIVRGNSVPKGPQEYALVISGGIVSSVGCEQLSEYIMTPTLSRYLTMSYAFGMLAVILIPALALLALYFFLQYRSIVTGSGGYKTSYLKDKESATPLVREETNDSNNREYEEYHDQVDEPKSEATTQ